MTTMPRLELRLRAEPSSARHAREAVARTATRLGVRRDVVDDIRLCVSEVVTNVICHAYLGEPGEVQVTCDRFRGGVLVVVRDFGLGTTPPPGPRRRDEGGFGWKIVESLSDRYSVRSTPDDGTEVWMSFGSATERPQGGRQLGRTRSRRTAERRAPGRDGPQD